MLANSFNKMVTRVTVLRYLLFLWILATFFIYYFLILSPDKWLLCKRHKAARLVCRIITHITASVHITHLIVRPQPVAPPSDVTQQNHSDWLEPRGGYLADYGDSTCGVNSYRSTLILILKEWVDLARDNNITYFLTYGSLLGAWRNGDQIPYDTDMDVYILSSDNEKVSRIKDDRSFSEFDGKFHLAMDEDWGVMPVSRRQRFTCDGKPLDVRVGNYDACTFQGPVGRLIKGEYFWLDIWDVDIVNGSVYDRYGPGFYYRYDDVFPLKKCKYMGLSMLCPNNPLVVFRAFYGKGVEDYQPRKICQHGSWTERKDVKATGRYQHRTTDLMF